MITADPDDVRRWWGPELAGRPCGPGPGEPHLLVVVDEVPDGPGPWAAVAGLTVLRVGAPPGRRPGPAVVRLLVGPDSLHRIAGDGAPSLLGRPDGLHVADAAALARRLARYRPAGADPGAEAGPRSAAGLPALLGLGPGPAGIAALRARWARSESDRLRVPIGLDERGAPVVLDLKESAQGGSGPHGLCVGSTGSGKSELLRTLVLGLAAAHSSAELNLVLVDFKGGATFLGFAGLPHVSAVITNLAGEVALVDRMADALAGEITRRQEVLRAAGNLAGVAEYAAARRAGAELPPLPALLVVVDEFSELLAQRPELTELLVTIGRLGRSLGLHLLLASQRLDEGRLRGLESHLSYRIALRTFSAAESRAVLGVPDAHQLPSAPGSAFLTTGTDELVRFRAAYVSGPAEVRARPGAGGGPRRAHRFRAGPVAVVPPGTATEPPGGGRRRAERPRHRDRRAERPGATCPPRLAAAAGHPARARHGARPGRRGARAGVHRRPPSGPGRPAAARPRRSGRPALPAAPRPTRPRPRRRVRARRRGRWPAVGQVDRPAHHGARTRAHPHPRRARRPRARLRRRRRAHPAARAAARRDGRRPPGRRPRPPHDRGVLRGARPPRATVPRHRDRLGRGVPGAPRGGCPGRRR